MEGLYAEEKNGDNIAFAKTGWAIVQGEALEDTEKSDHKIRGLVLDAQRLSVKLPVVRKVAKSGEIKLVKDKRGPVLKLEEGQTIICDVVSALIINTREWLFGQRPKK